MKMLYIANYQARFELHPAGCGLFKMAGIKVLPQKNGECLSNPVLVAYRTQAGYAIQSTQARLNNQIFILPMAYQVSKITNHVRNIAQHSFFNQSLKKLFENYQVKNFYIGLLQSNNNPVVENHGVADQVYTGKLINAVWNGLYLLPGGAGVSTNQKNLVKLIQLNHIDLQYYYQQPDDYVGLGVNQHFSLTTLEDDIKSNLKGHGFVCKKEPLGSRGINYEVYLQPAKFLAWYKSLFEKSMVSDQFMRKIEANKIAGFRYRTFYQGFNQIQVFYSQAKNQHNTILSMYILPSKITVLLVIPEASDLLDINGQFMHYFMDLFFKDANQFV